MATKEASRLKAEWTDMPDEWFQPLTFGELRIGEKFISLPFPGDNYGYGGFRGTFFIFTKTEAKLNAPYAFAYGKAADKFGTLADFPDSTFVIRVEE